MWDLEDAAVRLPLVTLGHRVGHGVDVAGRITPALTGLALPLETLIRQTVDAAVDRLGIEKPDPRIFALTLAARIAALFVTLVLLAYAVIATDLIAVVIVLGAAAIAQGLGVVRLVQRTNRELARLLDALSGEPPTGALPEGLPDEARSVIARPHPDAEPALAMLKAQGFRYNDVVDIFDAGPTVEAFIDHIDTVREATR